MDEENVIDYDAFWEQYSAKSPRKKVRVLGQLISLPFDIPLSLERRMSVTNMADKEALGQLLAEIYGEDVLDAWVDNGMGTKQMALLVSWTLLRVQGSDITLQDAAKAMETVSASGKLQTLLDDIGGQSKRTTDDSTTLAENNSRN